MIRRPPRSTLFPYHDALPICRIEQWNRRTSHPERSQYLIDDAVSPEQQSPSESSNDNRNKKWAEADNQKDRPPRWSHARENVRLDRKSTRLNSSHANISYAVF